jgi:hypothetical protein
VNTGSGAWSLASADPQQHGVLSKAKAGGGSQPYSKMANSPCVLGVVSVEAAHPISSSGVHTIPARMQQHTVSRWYTGALKAQCVRVHVSTRAVGSARIQMMERSRGGM